MHIRLVFNGILSFVAKWRAGTYRYAIFATIKSKLMPAKLQKQYCYLIIMYSEENAVKMRSFKSFSLRLRLCRFSDGINVELMP
jgi:hypothetical protein